MVPIKSPKLPPDYVLEAQNGLEWHIKTLFVSKELMGTDFEGSGRSTPSKFCC